MGWDDSEQRRRSIELHREGVLEAGQFTERLHLRNRRGEFADMPGGRVKSVLQKQTVHSSQHPIAGRPRWQFTDNRGVKKTGTLEKVVDRGGSDLTYFFRGDDDVLSVVGGPHVVRTKAGPLRSASGGLVPGGPHTAQSRRTPMIDASRERRQPGAGGVAPDADALRSMPLHQIAGIVQRDWKKPYFGAVPYLQALGSLSSHNDSYGQDSGRSIVAYFLSNATTWRGPVAKAVKAELKRRTGRR